MLCVLNCGLRSKKRRLLGEALSLSSPSACEPALLRPVSKPCGIPAPIGEGAALPAAPRRGSETDLVTMPGRGPP